MERTHTGSIDRENVADALSFDSTDGARVVTRFRLLDEAELSALPDPTWLIEGIIPEAGFAELHGPPGTYKSFLAVDLAMSVATGCEWAGRAVKQGPVVYVAAEGASGYKLRVPSWRSAKGTEDGAAFHLFPDPVQLLDSREVERFLSLLREKNVDPVLIVVDTLSRCFVGEDENSAKSMSLLVGAVDRLRRETGATVLLIHHTNKTGKAERGSIALRGAVDMLMAITRSADSITLRCLKMKDAPEFTPMHFRFEEYGVSGVLVPLTKGPVNGREDSGHELTERDLLCHEVLPMTPLTHGEWKRLAKEAGIPPGSFDRHRTAVLNAGLVTQGSNKRYHCAHSPDDIRSITPRRGDAMMPSGTPTPSGNPTEAAA
ncbi:MAG: helicase RepA family protein [Gemmatimonadota bacterium]